MKAAGARLAAGRPAWPAGRRILDLARGTAPAWLFGLRLGASVGLALYLAFWLQLDAPAWAGTSAAIVCQPQLGASLRKGWFRMIGTVVGAVVAVAMTAAFPQDRGAFLALLALWGGACAMAATLLRNFASYAAGLAALTTAVIASDQLGATGGPDGQAFMLAVMRVTEVCLGIACAGVILAATDLGRARRRLAEDVAGLIADIAAGFLRTLREAGRAQPDTRPLRREYLRRVIALDPAVDQAIGESAALRNRSLTLQAAIAGGFAALEGWRAVAVRLGSRRDDGVAAEAGTVLTALPPALLAAASAGRPAGWLRDPVRLDAEARVTALKLLALPAEAPSGRLLADQAGRMLAGLADMLNGLRLLADGHARSPVGRGAWRFQVPDWLPAVINAGRATATIVIVQLLWIITAWPSGAVAMIWAAVVAILFAARADQAYAGAAGYMLGNVVAVIGTATISFAVLPALTTFPAFALVLALYLVPAGALLASGWQPSVALGMVGSFVPFLSPTNEMTYDMAAFGNNAIALFVGSGIAMLGFRILPPLSPALQADRLLRLSRRDLRRLAAAPRRWTAQRWQALLYSRLAALPEAADPLQRARLLVTLGIGEEMLRLRSGIGQRSLAAALDAAFGEIAAGRGRAAVTRLAALDEALARASGTPAETAGAIRARGGILAISEALTEHAAYFDEGATG